MDAPIQQSPWGDFSQHSSEFIHGHLPAKKERCRKTSANNCVHLHRIGADSSFLSRAAETVSNVRKQILMLRNSFASQVHNIQTMAHASEGFRELTAETKLVLSEGALRCYESILKIERKQDKISEDRAFKTLKIALQELVRYSIIYKEYQKRSKCVQSETWISVKGAPLNSKLIREIEIEVSRQQFYQLAMEYLSSEKLRLNSVKEICRICESKVGLEDMGRHLQICQARYHQIQELQTNLNSFNKLQGQIQRAISSGDSPHLQVYADVIQKIKDIRCDDEVLDCILTEGCDSGIRLQNDLVMSFYVLVRNRIKILESLNLTAKQSMVWQEEASMMLEVNSIIKEVEKESSRESSGLADCSIADSQNNKEEDLSSNTSVNSFLGRKNDGDISSLPCKKIGKKKQVHWESKKAINTKRSLKDFEILKFLGKGAFGKVYLARRVLTNDYYAVKCIKMDTDLLQDSKKIQNLENEHNIFRRISGEFLVKAAFSFSEGGLHMFFLEYMPGGDFAALLEEEVYLDEDVAKFYLAEMVLAIEHLHNLNIIHRDLKPQNLVFDEKGHLKLTDFGLSKEGITKKLLITKEKASSAFQEAEETPRSITKSVGKRKTLLCKGDKSNSNKSFVGTPDYIAPEVLNGVSSQNTSIDWWSFGVIVYEVLIGEKPFGAMTIEKVFSNIRTMKIEWPPLGYDEGCISPEAFSLIKSLLNIDFSKRLGAESVDEIKEHPFFEGVCWEKLKTMSAPLPVKPLNDFLLAEDPTLRHLIEDEMNQVSSQLGQRIQLDHYMRVDLLLEKTLTQQEKVSREVKQKRTKISFLYNKCLGAAKSMGDVTNYH